MSCHGSGSAKQLEPANHGEGPTSLQLSTLTRPKQQQQHLQAHFLWSLSALRTKLSHGNNSSSICSMVSMRPACCK
jgi:hypothetical protein